MEFFILGILYVIVEALFPLLIFDLKTNNYGKRDKEEDEGES